MEEYFKEPRPLNSPEKQLGNPEDLDGLMEPQAVQTAPVKEIKPGLIVGVLAVLTLTGLFFTVNNWFDSLRLPFAKNATLANANVNASLDLTNTNVGDLLKLKQQDTDNDGLTDYDELYLYKTSPYIPDSDSDGFTDGEEVESNNDPNCPAGITCQNLTLPGSQAAVELPEDLSSFTPDQVRGLLLQSGASQEEVNALTDQELTDLYKQFVLENQTQNANSANSGLETLAPTDFEAVTPDQLRIFLQEQGVAKTDLENLTDNDLRQLWQEVIKGAQNNQ